MKAYVQHRYGSPDGLELRAVDPPTPRDDQVLLRVRASSVNPGDWVFMTGEPRLVRLMSGLRRPKHLNPGHDVAGHVEAVGSKVERFQPGDEVYGEAAGGAYAEYTAVAATHMARKPANLTFAQAAAVPVAGTAALQLLRAGGGLETGRRVLINGASGGVGSFAVQLARSFGAEVTAVCRDVSAKLVRTLGAMRVIDYERDDFAEGGERYDLLLDLVGNRRLADCARVLHRGGVYIASAAQAHHTWVGPLPRFLAMALTGPFRGVRMKAPISTPSAADLDTLRELIEAGRVTPVVSRCDPMPALPAALRRQGDGHARGKSVITI